MATRRLLLAALQLGLLWQMALSEDLVLDEDHAGHVMSESSNNEGPERFYSIGCYIDSEDNALPTLLATSNRMTVQMCVDAAKERGFNFFALKHGNQCLAGEDYVAAVKQGESASCTMACAGSMLERCGGFSDISLYTFGEIIATSFPAQPLEDIEPVPKPKPIKKPRKHGTPDDLFHKGLMYVKDASKVKPKFRKNGDRYKKGDHVVMGGKVWKMFYHKPDRKEMAEYKKYNDRIEKYNQQVEKHNAQIKQQ